MKAARMIASKWRKQRVLSRHKGVAVHIPETRLYTPANARVMLAKYSMVVLKPVIGSGGLGLIKVEKLSNHRWTCRSGTVTRTFNSLNALLRHIQRVKRRRRYLIQRGVRLATISGRPIDYRVKMIKETDRWKITAMVGRLARPGLFVTNLCRGGTQLKFREAVGKSLGLSEVPGKKETLRGVARTCTQLLEQSFPGIRQLGYDFGIDVNGHCWILEVNTRPH